MINKSIDERLFEQLMRAPHAVRRSLLASKCGENGHEGFRGCCEHGHGHGPQGPMGPEGCGGHGHGPEGCGGHGHGPGGHGHGHRHAFMRERLLGVIAGFEGGVRQKTLTEELRINPSSVSEMISKLQNDGYVMRTVDPDDKRATLIVLTELGEARAAEIADERQARFAGLFSALTEEEKEQLVALLEKLTTPAEA